MPSLNWIGREAILNHHTPNLLIEGDNLEALKALLPYARRKDQVEPNQAYAFVTSRNFAQAAVELTDALIENGFERYEAHAAVKSTQPQQPSFFTDAPLARQNVPAEGGVIFAIPCLAIRVDGQLELFQKHYYRAIGELKDEGEEFACAQFIDRLPQVKHWVRNMDRRGFWFQTSTDKFYPDFVAELMDERSSKVVQWTNVI